MTQTVIDPRTAGLDRKNFNAEQLKEGSVVFIKGTISFARLTRLLEGKELAESIVSAKARGIRYPTKEPHTSLQLENPQILVTDPSGQPTYNDLFMASQCYVSKTGKNAGKLLFNIDNKGQVLPVCLVNDPTTGAYRQIFLEKEPAAGQEVILAVNIYKPREYEQRGWGIAQVYFQHPIEYYNASGVSKDALAALGITVEGPITTVTNAESIEAQVAVTDAELENAYLNDSSDHTVVTPDGYALPSPGGIAPVQVVPVADAMAQAQYANQTPVATPTVMPDPTPAVAQATSPEMTPEQELALLRQKLAAMNAENTGAASAFTQSATPAPATTPTPATPAVDADPTTPANPWTPQGPGIAWPDA